MNGKGEEKQRGLWKIGLAEYGKKLDVELGTKFIDVAQQQENQSEVGHWLGLMNELLIVAIQGQAVWTSENIERVHGGKILSARDFQEAACCLTPSATKFDVFSWRAFCQNYDNSGNLALKNNNNVSDGLREKRYQLRLLNLWLGNHQGEPEERAQTLKGLLEAQLQLENQVRQSYMAIDKRPMAVKKLRDTAGRIAELPLERLIIGLERMDDLKLAFEGKGGIKPLLEMDLLWSLGGKTTVGVRDLSQFNQENLVLFRDLTAEISKMALGELPARLGQAYKLYGPESY